MARDDVDTQERNRDTVDLNRLLNRLERKLLTDTDPSGLPRSSYERRKIGANIEYAHSLILRLEHAMPASRTRDSKSRSFADLQQRRILLKKLQNRLHELDQLEDEDIEGQYAVHGEEEDLLSKYAPAKTHAVREPQADEQKSSAATTTTATTTTTTTTTTTERSPSFQTENQSQPTLRARHGAGQSADDTAQSTGSSLANERARLLTPRSLQMTAETGPEGSGNEKLLAHHTSEQENITSSLLNLATALKNSTLSFSDELASSNPLVDRATASLDKNVTGMESAERRMGMLRKMTEGKGWWARLGLYGWIAALWIALILVMFVMPKLRF